MAVKIWISFTYWSFYVTTTKATDSTHLFLINSNGVARKRATPTPDSAVNTNVDTLRTRSAKAAIAAGRCRSWWLGAGSPFAPSVSKRKGCEAPRRRKLAILSSCRHGKKNNNRLIICHHSSIKVMIICYGALTRRNPRVNGSYRTPIRITLVLWSSYVEHWILMSYVHDAL